MRLLPARRGALAALAFLGLLAGAAAAGTPAAPDLSRIVSVGGPVTEIVCALGLEQALIGVDTSSSYPESVTRLPQVGYQRALSAEGVLGLRPTLILASVEAGPPPVIDQLRHAGIPWASIPAETTVEGAKAKIRAVAAAVGRPAGGEALVRTLEQQIGAAQAAVGAASATAGTVRPKVLFIYARGGGTVNVAGQNTGADAMIALAGGANAVTGYTGYKPITAEAVVAAAPDLILIPQRGLESLGGIDGLLGQPGLAGTPAGKARRVVAMDDLLLLGFGPRLGQAVLDLAKQLHPAP